MFRGINSATLDAKGRMALPARVREALAAVSDGVVVTIDAKDRCLMLYPLAYWEEVQRRLESLPNMNPRSRTLQRLLIGHATDLEPDSAGRVLLPQKLREYANLDKKLVLVGQSNKVEIWSEASWEARMEDWLSDDSVAELADAEEFTGLQV
ncbi:MAG: division/cell wall cluster transcriptional repressor MraZ [Gammaproteobacteria bacterium]|jgi:MraZ protein|nr:division/cell wall cluster transcriptional repressor MraZ [Gammaproteobacteria bacterium]